LKNVKNFHLKTVVVFLSKNIYSWMSIEKECNKSLEYLLFFITHRCQFHIYEAVIQMVYLVVKAGFEKKYMEGGLTQYQMRVFCCLILARNSEFLLSDTSKEKQYLINRQIFLLTLFPVVVGLEYKLVYQLYNLDLFQKKLFPCCNGFEDESLALIKDVKQLYMSGLFYRDPEYSDINWNQYYQDAKDRFKLISIDHVLMNGRFKEAAVMLQASITGANECTLRMIASILSDKSYKDSIIYQTISDKRTGLLQQIIDVFKVEEVNDMLSENAIVKILKSDLSGKIKCGLLLKLSDEVKRDIVKKHSGMVNCLFLKGDVDVLCNLLEPVELRVIQNNYSNIYDQLVGDVVVYSKSWQKLKALIENKPYEASCFNAAP
jgi:hypothetical protein